MINAGPLIIALGKEELFVNRLKNWKFSGINGMHVGMVKECCELGLTLLKEQGKKAWSERHTKELEGDSDSNHVQG